MPLPAPTPDLGAVPLNKGGLLVLPAWREDIGIVPLSATVTIPGLDAIATANSLPTINGAAATVLRTGEVQYQLSRKYCTTEDVYEAIWEVTIPVIGAVDPTQATRVLEVTTDFVVTNDPVYLDINRFWADPACNTPTPAYLRAKQLKGIPLADKDKSLFLDAALQKAIDKAVNDIELRLDYTICPRVFTSVPPAEIPQMEVPPTLPPGLPVVEEAAYDYDPQKFRNSFSYLRLKRHPVGQVLAMQMRVGTAPVAQIPAAWIAKYVRQGDVNLVPDALTSLALSIGGIAYPLLRNSFGSNVIPSLWHVIYTAGVGADASLFELIAMTAAVNILENVGNQHYGTTSQSVSVDGLSQSQSFTVSPTSTLFGPQIATLQAQIDDWYKNNEDAYRGVVVGLI